MLQRHPPDTRERGCDTLGPGQITAGHFRAGLDTYAGPGPTGMNGMNGNPVCNPWSLIRTLLDTRGTGCNW